MFSHPWEQTAPSAHSSTSARERNFKAAASQRGTTEETFIFVPLFYQILEQSYCSRILWYSSVFCLVESCCYCCYFYCYCKTCYYRCGYCCSYCCYCQCFVIIVVLVAVVVSVLVDHVVLAVGVTVADVVVDTFTCILFFFLFSALGVHLSVKSYMNLP